MKKSYTFLVVVIVAMTLVCQLMPVVTVLAEDDTTDVSVDVIYTYAGIDEETGEIIIRAEASLYADPGDTGEVDAGTVLNSFVYSGQKWKKADLPVSYQIDDGGDHGDPASEFVSIPNGFQTWEDDYASDMDFTYAGTSTGIGAPLQDGNNIIIFVSKDGPGGNLATTFWWFTSPSGWILEFDMTFDDDDTWVDTGAGFDLETVALHEAGHTLSLGHDTDPRAVMYAYYGGVDRDLYYTDIMGIRYIYPGPGITHPALDRVEDPWYPVYIMLGDIMAEAAAIEDKIDFQVIPKLDDIKTVVDTIDSEVKKIEDKIDQKVIPKLDAIKAVVDTIDSEVKKIEDKLDFLIDKETVEIEVYKGLYGHTYYTTKYFMITTIAGQRCDINSISIYSEDTMLAPTDYTLTPLLTGFYQIDFNRNAIRYAEVLVIEVECIQSTHSYYGTTLKHLGEI